MSRLISPSEGAKVTNCVRTDPAEHVRCERAVAVIIALGFLILGVTAMGTPPDVPGPDGSTLGVCCPGGGAPVVPDVTWAVHLAHQTPESNHLWRAGTYDPVTDKSPCDDAPGGD